MKKNLSCFLLIFVLCLAHSCSRDKKEHVVSGNVLDVYLRYSPSTDPGEYDALLDELPTDLEQLCTLIKKQLIHPIDAGKFRDVLPEGRENEDKDFPTVGDMLKELVRRDPEGLTMYRRPENRLVVASYHHALLLASILRYQGVPTRIRSGFARYYEKQTGIRFDHTVCEVWDKATGTWILVDPERQQVDFPMHLFEIGPEAWQRLRMETIEPQKYTSSAGRGVRAILHVFIQDLSCIMLEEKPYWVEPPISQHKIRNIDNIEPDKLKTLDKIAKLLSHPDTHLKELSQLRKRHDYLQCQ